MAPGRLDITVLHGKELKNTQYFGRQDPFVVVQVGQRHFTSPVATDEGVNPRWDFRCSFEISNETSVHFTIRNRNVMTSDALLGTAEYPLSRVFADGKDDATVPVTRSSGRQQGYLSIILLFYPHSDTGKKKHGQSSTPGQQQPYPYYAPPGGFQQPPVMQGPPQGGQYGTFPHPSAPVAPSAPFMPESGARPLSGHPGSYPPSTTYPPQQPAVYPPSNQPPSGYPTAHQQPPYQPTSGPTTQQQQSSFPPSGYPMAQHQQSGYGPPGQPPVGYPTSTQAQYGSMGQPPPGYPMQQQPPGYPSYTSSYAYPPNQPPGYPPAHGKHGYSHPSPGGMPPSGYPQKHGHGGMYGSVPTAPAHMYVVQGKKHKYHGKKYKGKKWKK